MASYTRIQTGDSVINRIQDSVQKALNLLGSINMFNNSANTSVTNGNTTQRQQNVAGNSIPFTDGNLISNINLQSGTDNIISHRLGRTPNFFQVSNLNTNAIIWSPVTASLAAQSGQQAGVAVQWNDTSINLQCNTSCTVSILVN